MAALLRQGAGRIGGSVLKRTQAAVAEERCWLVPRRFSTDAEPKAIEEIQRMEEELYVVLSKAENLPKVEIWRNRLLLQDLAAHVKPRTHDSQWLLLTASRWLTNVVRAAGSVSCGCMLVVGMCGERHVEEKKKIILAMMKREQEQEQ